MEEHQRADGSIGGAGIVAAKQGTVWSVVARSCDGQKRPFQAPATTPLLLAAEAAGVALASACRNGSCRRCLAVCRVGRVRHTIEWPGLSAEEKAEGWVLPCVALAQSALQLDLPDTAADLGWT